jgi:hypothetical protein
VLGTQYFGMLVVDMSAVKLAGEAKQNNLPPECGQPIDEVSTEQMKKKKKSRIYYTNPERYSMCELKQIFKRYDTS